MLRSHLNATQVPTDFATATLTREGRGHGKIEVHNSLLNAILHDTQQIRKD
jgi:hypothetical protein